MAEIIILTFTEMNQTELASDETAQQMVELQRPLLSSQPTDFSSSHLQQPHREDDDHELITIDIEQKERTTQITQQMMEDEVISEDIKALTELSEDGLLSPLCCIYKVPPRIRVLKEEAYTPVVVSIGPFHHGDVRLREMERHKEIIFKRFTQRAMIDLDSLVELAKQSETKVRASYSEGINLCKKDLVKLILVDSVFIIELFIMHYRGHTVEYDAKLSEDWLASDILNDLLLLENQLPLFFLEELYNIAFPHNCRVDLPSFLELTYYYFNYFNKQKLEPKHEIKHFTDLLRLFYLPTTQPRRDKLKGDGSDTLMYSASELQEAGVKLKASTSKCLLDLKFSRHVLEIPQILVEDKIEILFRNVIALEQCYYPRKRYFTDYIYILDSLVNTNKDVEILTHRKIILNWLSDANEVATLFNGLGKDIYQFNFNKEYLDISKRLNEFYEDPWHKRKATLRRDYCNTPWQTVASIAAIILLILTITQTICSILQVVQK